MSPIDIVEAKAWLDAIPGGELGRDANGQWSEFAANGQPVVTVYGAYDTGKSSLLRRVLVDSGVEVPEWLTISARHETFEVNQVQAAGCLLRDTPGFVTGAGDARADMNTQLANTAIELTDIAVVVVTPQLATAEFPQLQELVSRDWASGSLWFVISRFDEAGVDPESDVDGYRERARRKTDELRRALELDDAVPVFVVSQDFAQMAGSDRNPDPGIWDDFREWDGVAELLQALDAVGGRGIVSIRAAAAQRFWRQAIVISLRGLRGEVSKYLEHEHFTDEGVRLRESWVAQLTALRNSADADLRANIAETIGQAVDDQRGATAIQDSLKRAVDLWYGRQESNIEKLLRSIDDTLALEKQRPSWAQLEELAESLRGESDSETNATVASDFVAPAVKRVSNAALQALIEYEKLSTLKKPKGTSASSAMNMSKRVAAATAVVPLVVEMSSIAEEFLNRRVSATDRERQRRAADAELDRVGERAASMAMSELEPLVDAARDAIFDATAERVELRDGLARLVGELQTLVESGQRLLDKQDI